MANIDLSKPGDYTFTNIKRSSKPTFTIRVVANIEIYVEEMRKLFDFGKIKTLLNRKDFKMVFDGMYGASGPYAKAIFSELGNKAVLINC